MATLGGSTWSTSVFPDARSGSFLLPVKASVRRADDVAAGDVVTVTLVLDLPGAPELRLSRGRRPQAR